ncbi:MAG: hypothetical protein LBT13_07420, partial [Treponema sp.]|nr:hypothetical protein [Treponema sp.]
MKKHGFFLGFTVILLAAIFTVTGCGPGAGGDDGGGDGDTRMTLTAGPAVNAGATDTSKAVTFTGATGLSLTKDDFAVSSGTISGVSVSGNTATVSIGFAANTGTTPKTYTVSIAPGSTKIKGSGTVAITQAATSDTRVALIAGPAVEVAASATTANVTFTGATGLSLSAADFAVISGGTMSGVNVNGDTATVSVGFAANTGTTPKTYTVSIAPGSTKIKGSAAVSITQVKVGDTPDTRKELTAGAAASTAASDTSKAVTFTGATGLIVTKDDFTVSSGGTISAVNVVSDTATVTVTFAANTEATPKTYTVSIAST